MFSTRLFIFSLFCISVLYAKKVCDLEDYKCLTRTTERIHLQFLHGITGVESSDPLLVDLIEANLPTITYKIIDGKLSGMKTCQVELVKLTPKDHKYNYNIGCSHLTLEAGYEVKGEIGPQFIEGKGTCKVDFYDYHFLFNGDYEIKKEKDGKEHLHLKNHNLELEVTGKVHYELKNLYNGDKEKSDIMHKFANENWQLTDKVTSRPTMEAFMNKHIKNANDYLTEVPVKDIFSE